MAGLKAASRLGFLSLGVPRQNTEQNSSNHGNGGSNMNNGSNFGNDY